MLLFVVYTKLCLTLWDPMDWVDTSSVWDPMGWVDTSPVCLLLGRQILYH